MTLMWHTFCLLFLVLTALMHSRAFITVDSPKNQFGLSSIFFRKAQIKKWEPLTLFQNDDQDYGFEVKGRKGSNLYYETRRRRSGRLGYNQTLLSKCYFDTNLYHKAYEKFYWEIRLSLLHDYATVNNNNINIPFNYSVTVDDYTTNGVVNGTYQIRLGRWLTWVRQNYRVEKDKICEGNPYNKLPPKYIAKLNEMKMNWDGVGIGWKPKAFQKRCNELLQFKERFGHTDVPGNWAENPSLGLWVKKQRILYRKRVEGLKSQLTTERVEMLKEIGFDFGKAGVGKSMVSMRSSNLSWNGEVVYFAEGKSDVPVDKDDKLRFYFEKQWWYNFRSLERYKKANGHCNVPLDYKLDLKLGYWVLEQQKQYEFLQQSGNCATYNKGVMTYPKSLLTPARMQALKDVMFNFSPTNTYTFPLPWEDIESLKFDNRKMLDLLMESTSGLELTEKNDVKDENMLLFSFLRRLRWENMHGKTRPVSDRDIKWLLDSEKDLHLFQSLDFSDDATIHGVSTLLQEEYNWWGNYHDFRRNASNGEYDVVPDGPWFSENLFNWADEQNRRFAAIINTGNVNTNNFHMAEWHYQVLYDIGYTFNENKPIGKVCIAQPGMKPSILSLESDLTGSINLNLPHEFKQEISQLKNVREKADEIAWLVRYEELRMHYSNVGSEKKVKSVDISDKRLALWVDNQQKQYVKYQKAGKTNLTGRRVRLLNEINFDWKVLKSGREGKWVVMVSDLYDFKEKHGHCYVPADYYPNRKLGQWVHSIRNSFLHSKSSDLGDGTSDLSRERVEELIRIGLDFKMDNCLYSRLSFETIWTCRFEELQHYHEKYGNYNVSIDYTSRYYDLGMWVNEQRLMFHRTLQGIPTQLNQRRIDNLKNIGFINDSIGGCGITVRETSTL